MQKRLLNINEVSQMIGIQVDTLYRWVSQRRIPYVKVGRLTKFDVVAIDEWIKEYSVPCDSF